MNLTPEQVNARLELWALLESLFFPFMLLFVFVVSEIVGCETASPDAAHVSRCASVCGTHGIEKVTLSECWCRKSEEEK